MPIKPKACITKVAVIGAGASGLVTARELIRAGFEVTIFERSQQVGGLWVYQEETESDALGQNVKKRIHSSLYNSLRTNLPRDIMAFSDYTFDSSGGGNDAWLRFPHHSQVRQYLENFAEDFALLDNIKFGTHVSLLETGSDTDIISLQLQSSDGQSWQQNFDAIAICSGHFAKPRVPQLNNMAAFTGYSLHSHNYRRPEDFKGQKVAVFGISASGVDIAREIAAQACDVYWCGDAFNALDGNAVTAPGCDNLHLYSCPTGADEAGNITFKANQPQKIDCFMYATGYHYDYPFIQQQDVVSVTDNYVAPLYKQIIPPGHHNIGFIGIPFLVIPFPFFEIQARWFSQALQQKIALPSADKMSAVVTARELSFAQAQRKQRKFHELGDEQNTYLNDLLAELKNPPLEPWFTDLMLECQRVRTQYPATFRDEEYLIQGPTQLAET